MRGKENSEEDFLKEWREFINKFDNVNIKYDTLKRREIVWLWNLFNNSAYTYLENMNGYEE